MGFARTRVAGGHGGYIAAKQCVRYCVFACYEKVLDQKEILRQTAGAGDFFSAPLVTVYLTVSDLPPSRKAFKFNDI
jgi:hypothetical protein